jgi:hypothetical protein
MARRDQGLQLREPRLQHPGKTGHFTQLVWTASTKIGAGRVFGTVDGEWHDTYIAVIFSLRGNVAGEYQANVHKATTT